MKYVDTKVVMSEIPDEITLAINISNCPCHCKGCHSSYLAEDVGEELEEDSLVKLLLDNEGITCVAFMGGDSEPEYINWLADLIRSMKGDSGTWCGVKIAWYSGRDKISDKINLENFDYIKIGHYDKLLGPLNERTTNQRLYKVENKQLFDITNKFWK